MTIDSLQEIALNEAALDAAMDEAGGGWGLHLSDEKRRWLMGEAIRAYLAATPKIGDTGTTAEGVEYVVVPKEPTEAMLSAMWSLRASNGGDGSRECYRAMTSPEALGGV